MKSTTYHFPTLNKVVKATSREEAEKKAKGEVKPKEVEAKKETSTTSKKK